MFSTVLGTIFYSIVVFIAGTLIGTPAWNYLKSKLPWNK